MGKDTKNKSGLTYSKLLEIKEQFEANEREAEQRKEGIMACQKPGLKMRKPGKGRKRK